MKKVLRRSTVLLLVAVAGVATLIVTSATASTQKKTAGGDVCVLFPDPATSIRWVHYDAPAMKASLKAAGVTAQIYNAGGDAQKQKAQADQCLGNGAKVIIEVAIDAGSAAAIEKAAQGEGRSVDRLRPPGQGRRRVDLRLVRRQGGRRAPGQGRRRRPEGEREVLAAAGRRRGQRRQRRTRTRSSSRAGTTRS